MALIEQKPEEPTPQLMEHLGALYEQEQSSSGELGGIREAIERVQNTLLNRGITVLRQAVQP